MRLVRFEEEFDRRTVELHPRLTVLTGVNPAVREHLLRAFQAIASGEDPRLRGLIEAHSVQFDLTYDNLQLLEFGHADEELDVVMRAGDLPASPPNWRPGEPIPAEQDLERLDIEFDVLTRNRSGAAEQVHRLRAAVSDVSRRRDEAMSRLDAISTGFDSEAMRRLNAARERVSLAESLVVADRVENPEVEHLRRELAEIGSQRTEADRDVERLGRIDVSTVATAAAALHKSLSERSSVDDLDNARKRLDAASNRRVMLQRAMAETGLQELTSARDSAYAALQRAEQELRSPELPVDVVDELESVHDEVWELEGKSSGFAAGRSRRRLAELRRHEQNLLDQLGFDTWSSYVMGVANDATSSERTARARIAREQYELAERRLGDAAIARPDAASDLAAAEADEAAARRELARLLGVDPATDLRGALHAKSPGGEPDLSAAVERVRDALVACGADLRNVTLDPEQALAVAQSWLATMDTLPDRLAAAESTSAELRRREAALADHLASLAQAEQARPAASPDLAAARRELAEAERHAAHQRDVRAEIDELRAEMQRLDHDSDRLESEFEMARRTVDDADVALDAIRAQRDEAHAELARFQSTMNSSPAVSEGDVQAIEWYVLARLAHQRGVSYAGSIPMLVDDAFAGWSVEDLPEVFERLGRMSDVVQLVYVTDSPDVVRWAETLGPDAAAVVEVGESATASW